MFPADSHPRALPARAAGAALLTVLAVLFWAGCDRLLGVEAGYHDLLQRVLASPGPARVAVISTGDSSPWSLPAMPELIDRLHAAGASMILTADPPPVPVRPQEIARLRALIDIEERAVKVRDGGQLGPLRDQLRSAEQRFEQQERLGRAITTAGNVILTLGTATARNVTAGNDACALRIAAGSGTFSAWVAQGAPVLQTQPAAAGMCAGARALAGAALHPDTDGRLRRPTLAVGTGNGTLPSAGLAGALLAGSQAVPPRGQLITRYYAGAGQQPAFETLAAGDVVAGRAGDQIRGRVVVIGATEAGLVTGWPTPVESLLTPALVLATETGNLIRGEHIVRPGWSRGFELILAILLALAAAAFLPQVSLKTGIMAAGVIALALLSVEFMLLATAGVWLQLASASLFCLTGIALLHGLQQLPLRQGRARSEARLARLPPSSPRAGEELDLAFSVLRQQATTEQTKLKLYELAMEHGRKRDYARSERVFRHLATLDPGYRDVAAKLERLSGMRGTPPPREGVTAPAQEHGSAPIPARTLGRYELERVIGRGAMGTVYLGRDPTINRRVAIKTLPLADEFADNELTTARANFAREAESSGRLNHPAIISIYDAGEDGRVAYLAMEYFEGRPLSYFAQLGRLLPPKLVCSLIARAAEALHYAHSQNVVHRDVKPANLLYDQRSDTLKLTDFGIARLTDSSRTRTGIILGTPSYMSPEQLSASKVTGQSDLYSLAMTLYHLLTGSPPFQADSIPRLMEKISHEKHRPVRDVRDDVPACLDVILDRALAKAPADRFPSGQAMALALRDCCGSFAEETR